MSLAILRWRIRHSHRAMLCPAACSWQQGCAGLGTSALPGPGSSAVSSEHQASPLPSPGLILHVPLDQGDEMQWQQ